jgi:hypothetical protein
LRFFAAILSPQISIAKARVHAAEATSPVMKDRSSGNNPANLHASVDRSGHEDSAFHTD